MAINGTLKLGISIIGCGSFISNLLLKFFLLLLSNGFSRKLCKLGEIKTMMIHQICGCISCFYQFSPLS